MANLIYDFSASYLNRNKKADINTITYRDIGIDKINISVETKYKNKLEQFDYSTVYDMNTSKTDYLAVSNSLSNLFTFKRGECILQPAFGNQLHSFLYEPINNYSAEKISKTIYEMVETWEPRISILKLVITPYVDDNCYGVQLYYNVPTLNSNDVNVFEHVLQSNNV